MSRDGDLTDPFKHDHHGGNPQMEINNLSVVLNMPKALTRRDGGSGEELAQGLPPYNKRPAFLVDRYPACPESWPRSSGAESSYVVPILPDHGLWLDLNGNGNHTHHVAALVSIQGVNALTGRPAKGSGLEQYKVNCPVHDQPFGADRLCSACGFKWPAQNYLATTGTPRNMFWIDGFRAADGVVRQYVFTEQTIRGVAAQLIGKDRVFAIGIVFYLSREPKPAPPPPVYRRPRLYCGDSGGGIVYGSAGFPENEMLSMAERGGPRVRSLTARSLAPAEVSVANIEIAAGARIDQNLYADPSSIDFWQPEPAGIIHINYASVRDCLEILKSGPIKLGSPEGFMKDIQVGAP